MISLYIPFKRQMLYKKFRKQPAMKKEDFSCSKLKLQNRQQFLFNGLVRPSEVLTRKTKKPIK